MSPNAREGQVDYIEFPATDTGALRRFYTAAFGWRFEDYGPNYTSFSDGRLAGGFQSSGEDRPSRPLVVVFAADLEGARKRVIQCGGHISREIFAFPGGRRFHFKDPDVNELAVWSDAKR